MKKCGGTSKHNLKKLKMMKNNKLLYISTLICLIGIMVSACDEDDFFTDNITKTGRAFPVVSIFLFDDASSFEPGGTVIGDVRFFSDDPIETINLFAEVGGQPQELVSTTPYEPAFSPVTKSDSLILEYTVPQVPQGTEITLEVEVVNENGLTKREDRSFEVE